MTSPDKSVAIQMKLTKLIQQLKFNPPSNTYETAVNIVNLLREAISSEEWSDVAADNLSQFVRRLGISLIRSQPCETVIGNIVRNILKIVREESTHSDDALESLRKSLMPDDDETKRLISCSSLLENVDEAIGELLSEMEASEENIVLHADSHILDGDVVLTHGESRTVEALLKHAASKRNVHVIVTEGSPHKQGIQLSQRLAVAGIDTTLISDAAVFALMPKVSKVVIGAHAVMADGGLKADPGTHAIALAAHHYNVPLIVCAAMYKLSPEYYCAADQEGFHRFDNPNCLASYSDDVLSKCNVIVPLYEYVPPNLVTMFASNIGGYATSYVYRLVNEMYHPGDLELV